MRIVLLLAMMMLQGCYYLQATQGQLSVMSKRQSVDRVISDPSTPAELRAQLELGQAVREFAITELGLPDNGSYTHYADLGREQALWNVVVVAEFSVEPLTWCAPFAGCVAYRGYFRKDAAERFAYRQEARGNDVRIGAVSAYSTLGWFRDPILSTMLGDELELAALIIHELAHQRFYAKSDSALSEAFATVVEMEGMRRWLSARGDEEAFERYERRVLRRMLHASLLQDTRERLGILYESGASESVMRERKRGVFEALRSQLGESHLRNNADLAAVATYYDRVPALQSLLEGLDGDLEAFYLEVETSVAAEHR